jgi:hypothetical protein
MRALKLEKSASSVNASRCVALLEPTNTVSRCRLMVSRLAVPFSQVARMYLNASMGRLNRSLNSRMPRLASTRSP